MSTTELNTRNTSQGGNETNTKIQVHPVKDGRVELIVEQSVTDYRGKTKPRKFFTIILSSVDAAILKGAL